MIVIISVSGRSFKGLSLYLTHDANAQTNVRVSWTHTHNLANDDILCAVNEMYLTAENAELLKQQAGVRAGGRKSENPVKHISLNWDPADNPSQKHMIETAEHFLKSMGWEEHQAIFVAHHDKPHKHVHLIINATHPETGRHLNEGWEKNRVQSWAAEYEHAQDCIRCPQRLQARNTREKAMPRNMWVAFQQNEKSFLHGEEFLRKSSEKELVGIGYIRNSEWQILKDIQRTEREQFFADGKKQFSELRNSIYRTVHEEFRERWNDYYQARRAGSNSDSLREFKQRIVADEKAVLDPRRDAACKELRANRDTQYRDIRDIQRGQRQTLRWHQQLGLDTSDFFADVQSRHNASDPAKQFGASGRLVTRPALGKSEEEHTGKTQSQRPFDRGARPLAPAASFGTSLLGSLILQFTNLGSAPAEPKSKSREEEFRLGAEDETRRREKISMDQDEEDRSQRSKVYNGRER